MQAIIKEKQISEEEASNLEEQELIPEKFNPDIQFKVNKEHSNVKRSSAYRPLTREETAWLIAASKEPIKSSPPPPIVDYPTYSREEVADLMRQHFEYKDMERKEREKWDSQKMTELEAKTEHRTKPSTFYEGLRAMGFDHPAIIQHAEFAKQASEDSFRIEVMNTMVSIVRSLDAKVNSN